MMKMKERNPEDDYTDLQRKIGNRHYKINTFPIVEDGEKVMALNIETWKMDGTSAIHHIQLILNDEGIEALLNPGRYADGAEKESG
jgi:hypothetical protein